MAHFRRFATRMSDFSHRILTIQSHVVSGYVGNKSAAFPLQLLGFEVDGINSVQFSNPTRYKNGTRGQVLNDTELWDIIEGLKANNLDRYSHIINGYIGSPSFLSKVAEVVRTMKEKNPDLIYVCDQEREREKTLGTYFYWGFESRVGNGTVEVAGFLELKYESVVKSDDITGSKIKSDEDAVNVMQKFHDQGVKTVFLSSTDHCPGTLVVMASKESIDGNNREVFTIDIPKFNCSFVGTGDLFTALCMAWLQKTNNDLKLTLEMVVSTLQSVLKNTLAHADKIKDPGQDGYETYQKELKILQSKREIESPCPSMSAVPLRL